MFEVFTNTSQTLAQNAPISFDNVKFENCRVKLNSAGTAFTISYPGRYYIHFDGVGGSSTTDSSFTIQLYVNGIAQPCALATNSVETAGQSEPLGFDTMVQVNNSCCCSDNSQTFQLIQTAAEAGTISHANLVVVKL